MLSEFLNLLKSQVDRGIYVWGGDGEIVSSMSDPIAWIERHETDVKNAARAIKLYKKRVNAGVKEIRAFDCSGLVYWAQKEAGIGYDDHTANGWYGECNKVTELSEGDLVFHHNGIKCTHVGVYVGGNTVIESKGRDDGVVATVYSKNAKYWNRQGRLRKLEDKYNVLGDVNLDGKITAADAACILQYIDGKLQLNEQQMKSADVNLDGKVTKEDANAILNFVVGNDTLPPHGTKQVIVVGGSVNVRAEGTSLSKNLGTAHRGDTFPYRGDAPSGWYEIDYKGIIGYISNKPKYTKII